MFVGRESELHFLEERYAQAGGQLVVLYGRATGIYKMTEMGFYDAIKFFLNYSIGIKLSHTRFSAGFRTI